MYPAAGGLPAARSLLSFVLFAKREVLSDRDIKIPAIQQDAVQLLVTDVICQFLQILTQGFAEIAL